ncbi:MULTISPECIES: biotin--[acetyl-CoA-carboxylase] ligase [Acidiphilium]|uniref:biotin--[acetyl-CoA-carboxylase] ligase n=1 Tax=Acidiphilium TaxID=522 RepID=UPI00257E029D|nr:MULTISPECIES: biotin--[acetyl-CoA-carboxylase] ligase [Acidiphilium]HQT83361.1 biotin--[acetyl-CoA-carboxylase] ligase [Acidiphilium rubrum]
MTPFAPWRIEQFETLASTSDLCAERARAGEADRLLIIAASQTAGRGRAGRVWSSPPGNFYASALLRPGIPAAEGGLFALLAGLSLLEAIEQASGTDAVLRLKWPNDITAGAAKLAGILLDATIEAGRIATLVIGFGVNLAFAPEIPGRATTSLAAFGLRHALDDLAGFLCGRIDHWQADMTADAGANLRAAWLVRAHPIGSTISIDAGRLTGEFAGIDVDGSLLLRQGEQVTIIRSGDVALL